MGAELGINATHTKTNYSVVYYSADNQYKKHYSHHQGSVGIGASFLPGVMLTKKTMLYSRLGIEGNHSTEKYGPGFSFGTQVGLGVQTQITKKWDARIEYTGYSSNQPNQVVGLGLMYKFD